MKRFITSSILLAVSFFHLLPLIGVLGMDRLQHLYGFDVTDSNLEILLRHRALLFGVLGVFLAVSAFKPRYQIPVIIAGLVSVVSFIVLARLVGHYNAAIARVVFVDWWALGGLLVAGLMVASKSA
ncbi:MAG: phosphopantetheine adenylyltransferase [Woeseiaceae bacterium]